MVTWNLKCNLAVKVSTLEVNLGRKQFYGLITNEYEVAIL